MRLIAPHPDFELVSASGDSMAGRRAADLYPSLELDYQDVTFEPLDVAAVAGLDLVFLGLPHEASMELAPQIVGTVGCVVDLSAAYRLKDISQYPTFYGFEHTQSALLAEAVFGLPELHRDQLVRGAADRHTRMSRHRGDARAAAPGGGRSGRHDRDRGRHAHGDHAVQDARRPTPTSSRNVDSNVVAYGMIDHRHTPEMEQEIGATLLFTPHLVPMSRGLLATCYARAGRSEPRPMTSSTCCAITTPTSRSSP